MFSDIDEIPEEAFHPPPRPASFYTNVVHVAGAQVETTEMDACHQRAQEWLARDVERAVLEWMMEDAAGGERAKECAERRPMS